MSKDPYETLRRAAKKSALLREAYRRAAPVRQRVLLGIDEARARLAGKAGGRGAGGVNPENIVWIFGTGRSGSTWLRGMMEDLDGHQAWEEPMVGRLFGEFYNGTQEVDLGRPDFVMSNLTRKGWTRAIRNFVLECVGYARPKLGPDGYLVVKEPNGSMGAPLLMEALPESRMILLIRDPRDVVASMLDAAREGGWLYRRKESDDWRRRAKADNDPDTYVRNRSRKYLQHAGSAKKAYDAHRGPKALIRYEDLRSDALGTMRRLYGALGIFVDDAELVRVVEKHSWENVPREKKGEGKFYRKATPGGWSTDLTPEQAETVEKVTAPLLKEFYPGA